MRRVVDGVDGGATTRASVHTLDERRGRKRMEDDDFPDDADLVRLLQSAKRAGYGTTEDDGGGNFEEAHFFDIVWRGVTRVIGEPAATDEDPLTWQRLFDWMIRRNARFIREDSQFGTSPSTNAYAASPIVACRLRRLEDIVGSGFAQPTHGHRAPRAQPHQR